MKKLLLNFGGVLVCLLGTLSCARLDIAVTWADTYIASQVDDYFDLNSQQNKDLKGSLKKDIRKIRKEQFTQWAVGLRRFRKDFLENTLTEESFHKYFAETLEKTRMLQSYFTNTAVNFISTTSPAQLAHFEQTIRRKGVENEEKIQNSEQARKENRKNYLRWTELWIDSLSKEQEQLLNQHLNDHPFPAQAQIKSKNHTLEQFHEARKSSEDLKNFVRNYYDYKNPSADPEYRQALNSYHAELEKFLFQLIKSLNEKQRKLLPENLSEKASSLEKLAAKD
jgi:hypothetical protein